MTPQLYNKNDYASLQWPETPEADYAHQFLFPLITHGSQALIDNVQTELMCLKLDDQILPVTLNEAQYSNCYSCSPITQYITYGDVQLSNLKNPFLKCIGHPPLALLRSFFQLCHLNRVIAVNNWLLPTNLWPSVTAAQIEKSIPFLQARFPNHAILFKSINRKSTPELFHFFCAKKAAMIPTRPVYLLDTRLERPFQARMFKSDLKVLEKTSYSVLNHAEIPLDQAERLMFLYRDLNLRKYTSINPQYNVRFVENALKHKSLEFFALQKDGRIDACVGFFSRNHIITSPFFGYDTSLPQELGLYRLISTLLVLEAKKRGVLLHQSSGAGSFKKLRRAQKVMEYNVAIFDHLPLRQRLGWQSLYQMMTLAGQPIMQHLEL